MHESWGGAYSRGGGLIEELRMLTCLFICFNLKIIVDGKTEAQPSGYPKADTQGSKERFIFRTFKFNGTAVFDPTISVGDSDDEPETPTDKALAIQLNIAMFVVMLITLFM